MFAKDRNGKTYLQKLFLFPLTPYVSRFYAPLLAGELDNFTAADKADGIYPYFTRLYNSLPDTPLPADFATNIVSGVMFLVINTSSDKISLPTHSVLDPSIDLRDVISNTFIEYAVPDIKVQQSVSETLQELLTNILNADGHWQRNLTIFSQLRDAQNPTIH